MNSTCKHEWPPLDNNEAENQCEFMWRERERDLGVDVKDVVTLETYLQDYFTNILKKLQDLKAQSKQTDIYI